MRRPHWMRGAKTRMYFTPPGGGKPSNRYLLGIFLCLIGAGIMLAAIPGWLYLLLFGGGVLTLGIFTVQGR